MTKILRFLMIGLVACIGPVVAQEISSDHPILTEGAFANLTYTAAPIMANSATGDGRKTFRLINGVFRPKFNTEGYIERTGAHLTKVEAADVTGDGKKEGIAFVLPLHSGNAVWYGVYIYSMSNDRPSKLLWAFATGDRGVGGLKKVYGKRGRLIVELWGWASGPNNPPKTHWEAQAGSSWFTRREYRWNGRRFKQIGKARIFRSP